MSYEDDRDKRISEPMRSIATCSTPTEAFREVADWGREWEQQNVHVMIGDKASAERAMALQDLELEKARSAKLLEALNEIMDQAHCMAKIGPGSSKTPWQNFMSLKSIAHKAVLDYRKEEYGKDADDLQSIRQTNTAD